MVVSDLRLDPSTSSMVSGSGLLAVSGSSRVRAEPSRGQRPHRTMGAWGLMLRKRCIMGASTPPVRAHMEPIPIPFCLRGDGGSEGQNRETRLHHITFYISDQAQSSDKNLSLMYCGCALLVYSSVSQSVLWGRLCRVLSWNQQTSLWHRCLQTETVCLHLYHSGHFIGVFGLHMHIQSFNCLRFFR